MTHGRRSLSISELPVLMPFALRNVYAAAPPIIALSAFGSRCSSAPILSFILMPPTTSVKGLIGFSLIIDRYSTSLLKLKPASLVSKSHAAP